MRRQVQKFQIITKTDTDKEKSEDRYNILQTQRQECRIEHKMKRRDERPQEQMYIPRTEMLMNPFTQMKY